MVTDQKHSSDISSEQEVIRRTEKTARIFGLDKQNAEVYSTLSGEIKALEERVKWLDGDVDELFAMEHCNCSKESHK